MITPLVKCTLDGVVYTRDKKIEAILTDLDVLSRSDLVARCMIRDRSDPGYVPSECLLYFVRASRANNSDAHFERLYKIMMARVLGALPKAETIAGEIMRVSLTKSRIREKAFDRFVELLVADRQAYSEKLDYFEVRFDGALANLRRDAQDTAWREENRTIPLEYDAETNEPSAEVERAIGTFDPFGASAFDADDYRSRLDAAIDSLPPEQSRIIEMLRQGFPIDSKDADAMTIAKALGKSEKTIRTHRDRALAALRAALSSEDEQ
jgi:DNA-binding CsgD family transcriptional regulator